MSVSKAPSIPSRSPGACEEDGPLLLGHLLCGVLFGTLLAAACLLVELTVMSALAAYVIGVNVGFAASFGAPTS